jgi:hypothetical protein
MSYTQALRAITDLGLQPTVACGYKADVDAGRVIRINTGLGWQPAGQRDQFEREHRLFVATTPLAASDWSARLEAVPGVLPKIPLSMVSQPIYCLNADMRSSDVSLTPGTPAGSTDASPTPSTPLVLTSDQVQDGLYARVVFGSFTDYATALAEVSNLGVRLADPCYEQLQFRLQSQSKEPTWHAMGQEASFAASHALIVAPAPLTTATSWASQLRALTTVSDVAIPYVRAC